MKQSAHDSVKIICVSMAIVAISFLAYKEVFSHSSIDTSAAESVRIFSAFMEKEHAATNDSITLQLTQSTKGDQDNAQASLRGQSRLSNVEGIAPLDVTFAVKKMFGNDSSYDWSFGDGDIARGSHVSHTFQYEGTYSVTLKMADRSGATRMDRVTVRVVAAATHK